MAKVVAEPNITLPDRCTDAALARVLDRVHGDAELVVTSRTFLTVDGLALLSAWILRHRAGGHSVTFTGDEQHCRYLARMGIGEMAKVVTPRYRPKPAAGRFMPLCPLGGRDDHASVKRAVDGVCDLIVRNFDQSETFLRAFEWAIQELVDNVVIHSQSPTSGIVCAQVYPARHTIDVGICDMGIGIAASLRTRYSIESDRAAIELATERGVTRDPSVGQGNGLAGARLIAEVNHGRLQLRSGDSEVQFEHTGVKKSHLPSLPGTGVYLSLCTDRPVDLSKTWIAGGGSMYFEAEAERLATIDGIVLRDECAHFGGRPPAELVRRKIESVIADGAYNGTPLRIDFSDVKSPSSSFLDELIGKLVEKFGLQTVKERTRFVDAGSAVRAMLTTVVAQRLRPR